MDGDTRQASTTARLRSPGRPRNAGIQSRSSRDRLLDAAIELFARYGYDPVTTGQVAEAAGLTQSMVHYHFGSKANLWEASIDRLMRERGELFRPDRLDLSHLDPADRLRELTRRLVEANAAQPNHGRIAIHEGAVGGPRLDWLVQRYLRAGYRAFDDAVRDAMEAGVIRPMPVHDVSNVLTSAASLAFSLGAVINQIYGVEMRDPERLRSFTDSLLSILFDGLATRSDAAEPSVPSRAD